MSVTLVGGPDDFAPAYNPIWFYFESTNKNEPSFRYIVDLYERLTASTQTLIARYRIAPRPTDGYCEFNCSRVLSSFLTHQLPNAAFELNPTDSYVRYNIEVGEEFSVPWEYDDYVFYSDSGQPYNAYTQLTSVAAHTFVVGDQINIVSDSTPPFDFEGLRTVVKVIDANNLVIDVVFASSGATIGGEATYANNTKTITENLLTVSDYVAFNGALTHAEFPSYVATTKFGLTTGNLGQAASTLPAEVTLRENAEMALNFFNDKSWTGIKYLYGDNDTSDVWRRATSSGVANNPMTLMPVGPGNISLNQQVSGTGALIQSSTLWYRFWLADASGVRTSEIYTVNIDRKCSNFREFDATFLDRLGSLGAFSFKLKADEDMSVTRENHTFMLGGLSGGKWTYSSFDTGQRTTNVDAEQTVTLRTEWLTDAESLYFRELVSSPQVWLSEEGGSLYPAICETNSIQVQRRPQTKNVKYTIKFKYSNNEMLNI